jgi:CDP-glucose 4,6-dehydratase
MEGLEVNKDFWIGRRVLITGHTGFKGSWLSIWMQSLGAEVIGVSLDPPTSPSLYIKANVGKNMVSLRENISNGEAIKKIFKKYKPEIVFHLAAQPLVRYSYKDPVETYETNVMGTLHVLEGIRCIDSVRAAVFVTSDKCYENNELETSYIESSPMGGFDPYSSSKGAAELLISSYRNSYFPLNQYSEHKTAIASARAGNVIGGGDWAQDRLIPDLINSLQDRKNIIIRYPNAIRPWQHVLEPLSGYILLCEALIENGPQFSEGWNFGPDNSGNISVEAIVKKLCELWGSESEWNIDKREKFHEANLLKLDCSKANQRLDWNPRWSVDEALSKVVEWNRTSQKIGTKEICLQQIEEYMALQ